MTLSISPELEAKLRERAAQEGADPNDVAEVLLTAALESDMNEREETIEGIRRGLEAGRAGRVRPAEDVFTDMRAKLPPSVL